MFALLITTLEAAIVAGSIKGKPRQVLRPVQTTTVNFMSEEQRAEAIKRLDEYNFKRKAEDMVDIIGHISYLYVKL